MKILKIIVLSFIFLSISVLSVQADELMPVEKLQHYQQKVMQTGFRLLNGSLYEKRMTFYFENSSKPDIKINKRAKKVTITKGVFPFIDNDDELAAALSTAIASLTDAQDGFFRRFSMGFSPRKYEMKADKKAVDIMVKAGYNPIGLIDFIAKTDKESSWFEYNPCNHNGSERMTYIYRYIYEKYPIYLAQNEYLKEDSYQNFLRTSKEERKKIRNLQLHRANQQKSKKQGI